MKIIETGQLDLGDTLLAREIVAELMSRVGQNMASEKWAKIICDVLYRMYPDKFTQDGAISTSAEEDGSIEKIVMGLFNEKNASKILLEIHSMRKIPHNTQFRNSLN